MSLHVIVGAGATGIATAHLLADAGDQVRLVTRSGRGPRRPGIELVAADATDADRLTELTTGARTLFGCAAPAYDRWPALFPPLAAALLAAAERTGAGYVMLGNTYGYGPVDGPITEDRPLAPITVKGRVRAAMWHDALAAHHAGRVRATEVRAADFLGAGAYSLYNLLVAPKILAGAPAAFPGDLDAAHSWAYVGEVARALVAISRDDRAWGRSWHAPSVPLSVRELSRRLVAASAPDTADTADTAEAREPELVRLTAAELAAAGAADPVTAEVVEMLYLYERPCVLDSTSTEQTFALPPGSLDVALAETAAADPGNGRAGLRGEGRTVR
ncbi:nucleoside-diphosphate-sugar epimerase [Frankia torreyi]|uniref:Nucleoside-diphosphate-sugar epimerase n=2 Tax=Frankia TaxID=1854 RepID=A0A0D8BB97_9ACTN|nr:MULTISPECIES: NAD-dependent epimerase/dehydratase family protein [Frankia]KJE21360.1 nucleoside-diphosphate-sugar epimerase [Frankia torreyi]KQM03465.1 nucleoside-diphosphate-sugar epimerase [Frankia sp. CpI1-P]